MKKSDPLSGVVLQLLDSPFFRMLRFAVITFTGISCSLYFHSVWIIFVSIVLAWYFSKTDLKIVRFQRLSDQQWRLTDRNGKSYIVIQQGIPFRSAYLVVLFLKHLATQRHYKVIIPYDGLAPAQFTLLLSSLWK